MLTPVDVCMWSDWYGPLLQKYVLAKSVKICDAVDLSVAYEVPLRSLKAVEPAMIKLHFFFNSKAHLFSIISC